jgi:sugar lactone lactonase YvrE
VRSGRVLAATLLFGTIAFLPEASLCQKTRAIDTPIDGPAALGIDHDGHLFVASLYENNVRRVDLKSGTIVTVAGNGKECCYSDNSKATEVSLGTIWALAVNSVGDIFISEGTQVRKVDARTGLISTVAGNGESGSTADGLLATSTSFSLIWGLAVDTDDNLYVADKGQGQIFKVETAIAPTGKVFRVAGNGRSGFTGDGGSAFDASFASVGSIVFDKRGNLIIADEENCRIRRMAHETGIIDTIAITEPLTACSESVKHNWAFASPTDLAIDAKGSIMFAETAMNVVMRINEHSTSPSIVAGNGEQDFTGDGGPAVKAALSGPSGLVIDSDGDLFISDIRNNRVRRVDALTRIIQTIVGNGLPGIIHVEM